MDNPTLVFAAAAVLIQTVGLVVTILRSASATRDRIESLQIDLTRLQVQAATRPDIDAALQAERSSWDARCKQHEQNCKEDRQRLHDRLSALAKRVQL